MEIVGCMLYVDLFRSVLYPRENQKQSVLSLLNYMEINKYNIFLKMILIINLYNIFILAILLTSHMGTEARLCISSNP